jgi:DNA gyrase inhibitor GyrI
MDDLDVRIVKLEPMTVAYALGFGESPEVLAWEKITKWAKSRGMLANIKAQRFFGFNNPDPTPGSPNYGYEQWIVVDRDAEAEGDVQTKEFPGGLFAVAKCHLSNIGEAWKQLVIWQEESTYKMGNLPCLEECLNPEVFITPEGIVTIDESMFDRLSFDLYLSIEE